MRRTDDAEDVDMDGVIEFRSGTALYAIAVRSPAPGTVRFVTPPEAALQVGVLDRPAGHEVAAHTHPATPMFVSGGSEFLYVETGRISVNLYDETWRQLGACELGAGDHIVMLRGGHAVTYLAPSRLIEVKQGPVSAAGPLKVFRHARLSDAPG